MNPYLRLIRPRQWAKNGFVLLPMFFGKQLFVAQDWLCSGIAFLCFCLCSSSIYAVNDIVDAGHDRNHPVKKHRPVAAGLVSVRMAIAVAIISICASLAFTAFIPSIWGTAIIAGYWIMNMAYCTFLKKTPILDVFIIAFGFVLRLALGGVACDIWLSPWIICMTFLLALLLALAKRRDDVLLSLQTESNQEEARKEMRKSANSYNLEFLSSALSMIAAVTMVCYILFTLSPETMARMGSQYVYLSSVFVLAGILRYLQKVFVYNDSGSPTKILWTDKFILGCIFGWVLTFFIILYL